MQRALSVTVILFIVTAGLQGCSTSPEDGFLEAMHRMGDAAGTNVTQLTDDELLGIAKAICDFESNNPSMTVPDRINAELEVLQQYGLTIVEAGIISQVAVDNMCPRNE